MGLELLIVGCIIITTASAKYPSQVSLNDIHSYNARDIIPFIDNMKYLKKLSSYASSQHIKSVLTILGPKDSGKSRALSLMMRPWTDKEHMIINLNLKGTRFGNGLELIPIVSYQFIKMLSALEFKSLDELFAIINADCATKSEESLLVISLKFFVEHYIIFASIAAVAVASFGAIRDQEFLPHKMCYSILTILAIIIIFLHMFWFQPLLLLYFMQPIDTQLIKLMEIG